MPTTLKEFESVWPRIVADLQDHCKAYQLPQQSLDWFTKVSLPCISHHHVTCSHPNPVSRLQHSRREVQPGHVSHRHRLHPQQ